ncbi:lytic transglycosylase domain-containing protein, partial [Aggregatibacter actinomycetemcomitans]
RLIKNRPKPETVSNESQQVIRESVSKTFKF